MALSSQPFNGKTQPHMNHLQIPGVKITPGKLMTDGMTLA